MKRYSTNHQRNVTKSITRLPLPTQQDNNKKQRGTPHDLLVKRADLTQPISQPPRPNNLKCQVLLHTCPQTQQGEIEKGLWCDHAPIGGFSLLPPTTFFGKCIHPLNKKRRKKINVCKNVEKLEPLCVAVKWQSCHGNVQRFLS